MNLLLDTHVVLWLAGDCDKLTAEVKEILADKDRNFHAHPGPDHARPRSGLHVNILAQSAIYGRLVFGMPAFEPFQDIGVKPQAYRLLHWPEELATGKTGKIPDFRNV